MNLDTHTTVSTDTPGDFKEPFKKTTPAEAPKEEKKVLRKKVRLDKVPRHYFVGTRKQLLEKRTAEDAGLLPLDKLFAAVEDEIAARAKACEAEENTVKAELPNDLTEDKAKSVTTDKYWQGHAMKRTKLLHESDEPIMMRVDEYSEEEDYEEEEEEEEGEADADMHDPHEDAKQEMGAKNEN